MAPTTDPRGGPDLSDIPQPNASGMLVGGSSSFSDADALGLKVFVGPHKVGQEPVDPRQQKVNEQLGIPYSPPSVTQGSFNIATLMSQFDRFSHKQFLTWKDRLAAAGYSVGSGSALEVRTAYQSMLVDVAQQQASIGQGGMGRSHLTPIKYLNNMIRMSGGSLNGSGPTKTKTTQISRNIYELDPGEARTILTKTLQQYLGRDPSKGEVADFTDAVNQAAEDDPTVKATTTKYVKRADGTLKKVTSTTDTRQTGFTSDDAMWEAIDEAKASPQYDDYQAVSEYFPVIESLLSASAGL